MNKGSHDVPKRKIAKEEVEFSRKGLETMGSGETLKGTRRCSLYRDRYYRGRVFMADSLCAS